MVVIQPHLGRAAGKLQFLGYRGLHSAARKVGRHPSGVDGDWISNWRSSGDTIRWRISVVTSRNFDVGIRLRGKLINSHNVVVRLGNAALSRELARKSVRKDEWNLVSFGNIKLSQGVHDLFVVVDDMGDEEMLELKNVTISF